MSKDSTLTGTARERLFSRVASMRKPENAEAPELVEPAAEKPAQLALEPLIVSAVFLRAARQPYFPDVVILQHIHRDAAQIAQEAGQRCRKCFLIALGQAQHIQAM